MKIKFQIRGSKSSKHDRRSERGVALIIALLCMIVISILAAAIIFSTQTELRTSANYRYTTQARYVAESGAQQTIQWIKQNWTPPANFTNTTQFNLSTFPAMYVGKNPPEKIVFAANSGLGAISDTYTDIDSTMDTNFKNSLVNVSSPFSSINGSASFNVAAQLLSATQVTVGGGSQWLTKWKIISQGTVGPGYNNGNGLAKVQVVEIVADVPKTTSSSTTVPNFNYGVFATGTGCNVVQMTGGSSPTNAYNSQASGNVGNSNPTLLGTGGTVASFGNISVHNGAHINGTVYSPFYNAGTAGTNGISCPSWTSVCGSNKNGWNSGSACSTPSNIWSVNEDNSGSAVGCNNGSSCTQSVQNMPPGMTSPSSMPAPTMPTVNPNTNACSALPGGLCSGGNGGGGGCAATMSPSPVGTSYGQVNFGSCAVITLQPGIYNFDTLLISNGAQIILPTGGAVVIN
ncbi:MAG TPA: pilus assembly PilX N-terminal domain-containing protein, partial [Terriglobales bacterium]|nr:pilus assembly PilX N-terminal domain-containing protein [Terriglobales bacterium]